MAFNLNYFSIALLFKTFFSPWRRYTWEYPRGFDIGKILETLFSNLISRLIGAIVRLFFIILGIICELLIFLIGLTLLLGWYFLPVILIGSLMLILKFIL